MSTGIISGNAAALKLTKDQGVKLLNPDSALIPVLKEAGWVVEGDKPAPLEKQDDYLEELRAQAEALGLKVHHKAGPEKIASMIEEATGE